MNKNRSLSAQNLTTSRTSSRSSKVFTGTVVSDKMQKTVVVEITRKVQHPVYKKIIKKSRKLKADANGMEVKAGDVVKLEETRPVSRDKNFKVVEVVR